MQQRIGIDVGGTNTDAVLMQGQEVVDWVKTSTTADVTSGIVTALQELLQQTTAVPSDIRDTVNREATQAAPVDESFADKLLFWRTPEKKPPSSSANSSAEPVSTWDASRPRP